MRFLAALVLVGCASQDAAPRPRPNILLILADDLGFSDLGCYGGEIRTPNLDRLAAEGMRFTQFYNGARCCPTRASLLTGLYAHQAGVGHMVEDRGLPAYQGRLNDRCATIAEVLRTAGYRTFMSGKWHVGQKRPHWPVDRGFDRSRTLIGGGTNYFFLEKGRTMAEDGVPFSTVPGFDVYFTNTFTHYAVEFLDEARESARPFFLYLAYTAPHWPLQALPEDIERYRGAYASGWDVARRERHRRLAGIVDAPLSPRDARVPAWEEAKDRGLQALKMAVYAAMVDRMDQGIGRVLAKLDAIGAREDTIVLFLSDNGASPEEYARVTPETPPGPKESFHTCGPPWASVSNTPFRNHKRSVHEGGISTPMIVRWPSVVAPGSMTREPGHLVDLMATFVDVSGAEYPKAAIPMEGRSLGPALRGGSLGERDLFWEHEGNRAVRSGRWKLVAAHGGPWELYDLERDRTELDDLAARHPGRVAALAAKWDAWAERVGVVPWERLSPPSNAPSGIPSVFNIQGASGTSEEPMKRDLVLHLSLFALLGVAWGQNEPNKPQDPNKKDGFKANVQVDQATVDKAIEKGLAFLKTSDSPKSHVGDSDELKLLTHIHGGTPESDAAFDALLKKCLEAPLEKTYGVALLAMCLEELDRVKYQNKIAQCGQFLLDNMKANGGWNYGEPTVYTLDVPTGSPRKDVASAGGAVKAGEPLPPPGEKIKPKVTNTVKLTKKKDGGAQRSDNSNSQYAALGMRACHDAGIVFPTSWVEKARAYWVNNQAAAEKGEGGRPSVASGSYPVGTPRGWCYNDSQDTGCGHGGVPYSSMTAGAIGAVCIYDYMLKKDWKKDKPVVDGLAWLEKNWSVTENVGPSETAKGSPNGWLYYYLYAVERTGMLYDTTFIGNHDWYLEGARILLNAQKPDGSWDASHFKHPTWDTCFAILFLKRATRRLVATGGGLAAPKK